MSWRIIQKRRQGYDIHLGEFRPRDWQHLEVRLSELWCRLAEVLPRYYGDPGGRRTWDRLVCVVNLISGTIVVLFGKGHDVRRLVIGRVHVVMRLQLISTRYRDLVGAQEHWRGDVVNRLYGNVFTVVASSTRTPQGSAAIATMKRWRRFKMFVAKVDGTHQVEIPGRIPHSGRPRTNEARARPR